MTQLFGAIGIAGTGVTVYRKWLDAISDNLANMNDVVPTNRDAFQARYVIAQAANYGKGDGGARSAASRSAHPRAGSSTSRKARSPTRTGTCATRTSISVARWRR